MFSFFNELMGKVKALSQRVDAYQTVMVGDYLLYVEGFKSLMTLSCETIVFKVKNAVLTVSGQNLAIKEMSSGTITISGKIDRVERV
ncbi:MAG: hypothetical protein E7378_00835 [Clostridiales bacterium]|nr:hypothetical protein [Clostridiales bacterium]